MLINIARVFLASRNNIFRIMSVRTQATSTTPADMVFTFASPSEVKSREMEC